MIAVHASSKAEQLLTFFPAGGVDFGNVSLNVTFAVGASEACFGVVIYMDEEMENIEQFRLKIVKTTEGIKLDRDMEVLVIAILDRESRGYYV